MSFVALPSLKLAESMAKRPVGHPEALQKWQSKHSFTLVQAQHEEADAEPMYEPAPQAVTLPWHAMTNSCQLCGSDLLTMPMYNTSPPTA